MKIKDVAFIVECTHCRGSGEFVLPGFGWSCLKCNGHGQYIQPTTKEEMVKHLEGLDQNNATVAVQHSTDGDCATFKEPEILVPTGR